MAACFIERESVTFVITRNSRLNLRTKGRCILETILIRSKPQGGIVSAFFLPLEEETSRVRVI